MNAEFDWSSFNPVSVHKTTREAVEKAEFLQCLNCDFISKPKDFFHENDDPKFHCPSCGNDDAVIVDLSKPYYLTREQIIDQIAWQEEIRGKGAVKAIIQHFLKGKTVPHQETEP